MKIYGFSGLGADKRVFKYLSLKHQLVPIEWIEPKESESIEQYSIRLSKVINKEEKFGILGVSFGGLIAVEISKVLNPEVTILISTAETKNDLRPIFKIVGILGILKLFPAKFFDPPRFLAKWVFGTKNNGKLLDEILNDTDLNFAKWAINELANWKNINKLQNRVLKIGGTNDKLMPIGNQKSTIKILQGEHFMIIENAKEISKIINGKTLYNNA